MQAVEIKALLRLKGLLHGLTAIALLQLFSGLGPDRRDRDCDESDGTEQAENTGACLSFDWNHRAIPRVWPLQCSIASTPRWTLSDTASLCLATGAAYSDST